MPHGELVDVDDDIQFLYEIEPLKCQLCSTSLQKLSTEQRQTHYDAHFTEEQRLQASRSLANQPSSPSNSRNNAKSRPRSPRLAGDAPPAKQNVFWFPGQATMPPDNFTPWLIPMLKCALLKTHAKGLTTRAILCHEGVTHVATESWDRGWGCGYRNFLMACTALMDQRIQPFYFPLLDDPMPPGVRNLQYWIEDAWADGFDGEGAGQLKHKLVGTKKWIGTAELYVAFVSRGIPARLVDFPGSERGPEAVTEWIMNYFSSHIPNEHPADAFSALKGASPVICTDRMPLILQHAGHSRTVIGFEVNKKGCPNLLIFDPSIRPGQQLRRAALAKHSVPSTSQSKHNHHSPSILRRILHRHHRETEDKNRKRRMSNSLLDLDGREMKRVREGLQGPSDSDNIILDKIEASDPVDLEGMDMNKVVNSFRVNQNKLRRHDRYQILYFPLDSPLEDGERWARRVVTSERVV